MSHASIPSALRDRLAPPSDLVRLSVGIEDVDDLLADLERAFSEIDLRCLVSTDQFVADLS